MEIVVVGCKGFGNVHLRSIKGVDISIVERNDSVAKEVMQKYSIKKRYPSFDEAIESDADIIDLVVPHHIHKDMAIKAMEAGKNVVIEKPIATSLKDADEMISTSKKHGIKFMVAEQYFFDPSVRYAVNIIKKGILGKIGTIIVRDQRYFDKPGWRTESDHMGGGSLIDGGIHYIDTLLNLGGNYSRIESGDTHLGSSIQGEDNATALFHFNNGSTGLFYYSWAYRQPPQVPGIEVIGSEGSIYEDVNSRSQLDFKFPDRKTAFGGLMLNGKPADVEFYDVFEKEFSEFIESVKNDTPVPFDPNLARRDLAAVLEIYNNGPHS
ncbi:MAG: Gfo/Idh/MocA family oxidoreductase [Candidatus Thermoplasmatota archaeon]|nr:Gfo/Idh/MocA family oxidoreductase [Candidatus Thermoplasmatota archaeon]